MRVLLCLVLLAVARMAQAQDAPQLGIFGTVESVEPLIVAGQQIDLPEGLRVISPLGTGQPLLRGDTLAVRAALIAGRLQAGRMLQVYPVMGPVSSVAETTANVMGTKVHIPPGSRVTAGQWYAVSGLWSGDTVITTRIRPVEQGSFGQLTGVLDVDILKVGDSRVIGAIAPKDGFGNDIWMLSGTPENDGLRVRLMSKGVFGAPVDLALWQGHATLPVASQTYMIHGTGIAGTAPDIQMPDAGELIVRCVHDGRVTQSAPKGLSTAFLVLGCARHIPAD